MPSGLSGRFSANGVVGATSITRAIRLLPRRAR
jgi:hypothetical protein